MKIKIKRAVGLAFIYIGSVVGAGFLSGQEIWRFIARHGKVGFSVVIITGIFFIVLAPILFKSGKKAGISNYQDLFYSYLPGPFPYFFDLLYSIFLIGSVSVMLAGAGTIFYKLLGLPYLVGVGLTIIFLLLTLLLRNEGIMAVNSILIPVLIVVSIYMVLSYLNNSLTLVETMVDFSVINGLTGNSEWIKDGLYYGAYNLVMAIAVMSTIVYNEEEGDILTGGIIGGLILTILLTLIFIGLRTAFSSTPREEIPLLYLAQNTGKGIYIAYIIALYFAMITTAIANYYAFTKRFVSLLKIKYELGLFLGLLFIIPLIPSGFSTLVNNLYPIFGGLALIITFFYIIIYLRES